MTADAPDERELLAMSAALDGEGPAPRAPSTAATAFAADARRLRRLARIGEAPPMPDLTAAVLQQLDEQRTPSRWRRLAPVAAAFVLGVAVAAAFLLDRHLETQPIAAATLEADARAALPSFPALDARVTVVEHGVHPDVPERRYAGTLQFRAAEFLTLSLTETTDLPPGWPTNDVTVVVDDDRAWRSRRLGCPIESMPECLAEPHLDGIDRRAPFSSGWAAPVELIVPVDSLRGASIVRTDDTTITATTTVAAAGSLVSTTVDNGGFRLVHADDEIEIRLDADTFVLQRFTIRASGSPARVQWATTWGYDDQPGSPIVTLELAPADAVPLDVVVPNIALNDGGFVDQPIPLVADVEAAIPAGFAAHRSGVLTTAGADVVEVATWASGRAHLRVRRSSIGAHARMSGEVQPAPNGTVVVDATRHEVTILTEDARYVVDGTLTLDELVTIAGSLPVDAVAPANRFPGRDFVEVDGLRLSVDLRPGVWLPPADRGDIVGVALRGTAGRFSPSVGELSWLENGTIVVVSGSTDIDVLLAAADLVTVP